MKKIISTSKAPAAVGPYSQAVQVNDTLYISGQIPLDPESGTLVPGGIREQCLQVMKNIGFILEEAGFNFNDVVKSTCLLANISDFKEMNEVYAQFYTHEMPARAAFAVKDLPLGALIEIETIAVK